MKNDLEYKLSESSEQTPRRFPRLALDWLCQRYEQAHTRFPLAVNYLSTATGTIGGDVIAKHFTDNSTVSVRDVVFTGTAAIAYSYLAPKMIEWSTALTNKISTVWQKLKNGTTHILFNTTVLTALYFPVNMVYWNYLSVKNQEPLTLANNLVGATTLAIASLPYFFADYVALKRFNQPETKKYLRPFYSAVELAWNALFASGNYVAKKL